LAFAVERATDPLYLQLCMAVSGVGGGRVFEVQSFAQDKKLDLLSRVCRIRTIAAAIIALCKYGEGCSQC